MRLNRRRFSRLVVSGIGLVAAACGLRKVREAGKQPTPQASLGIELRNENNPPEKPHWNVRFIDIIRALDADAWRLTVDGLVEHPQILSLPEVMALPSQTHSTRMVCVEGWSSRAKWEGFTYQTLAELVKPKPEAEWLYFECGDGYWEYLSVADLTKPRVLFAYKMDYELLHPKFGAPLRVVVPAKYGYKGPKTILRIAFMDQGAKGYWSTVGPYTTHGIIEPGLDYALDLKERRIMHGGEVTEY